jgi:cell wall-associated NlpC family hydrolase
MINEIDITGLVGIPFVSRGRDVNTGLDCWGLVIEVLKRIDINVPDFYVDAHDATSIADIKMVFESKWEKIPKPEIGVVVGMNLDRSCMPEITQHYGVCIDRRRFIHTIENQGVIITRFDHKFFKNIIEGYYKWSM